MSDHSETRIKLEAQLDDAVATLDRLENHLRNTDRSVPQDWPEQAQFRENDEVLEALAARTREKIAGLQRALERLSDGAYDRCSNCEGEIEPERRDVLPTTTVCSACAGSR